MAKRICAQLQEKSGTTPNCVFLKTVGKQKVETNDEAGRN